MTRTRRQSGRSWRVLATSAISVLLVGGGLSLNFPWPALGVLFALPWVVYGIDQIAAARRYGAYVFFGAAAVLQLGFVAKYAIHPAPTLFLFVWNAATVVAFALLLSFFRRNHWLWLAAVMLGADLSRAIAPQAARPYLHFLFSVLEVVALVAAFWRETKQLVPQLASGHKQGYGMGPPFVYGWRRMLGATDANKWLTGALVAMIAFMPSAAAGREPQGIRCVEVAAALGLRFTNSYGSTVATDGFGGQMQRDLGNGVAVGDYDRDGYLDVYILGQNGHPSRLFRNVPGPNRSRRFVDVTESAGLGGQRGLSRVAFFVDLTGNGLLDLIVINDRDPAGQLPPSKIYRNNGDGTFSDVTKSSGFDPVGYIVSGAAVADYDGDGLPDIYISYWTNNRGRSVNATVGPPPDQFPGFNRLYRNLGNLHFKDVTLENGLGKLSLDSFTPVFANFTNSGYPDIFLPMDYGEGDRYLKNEAGLFHDASSEFHIGHVGNDMGVAVTDLSGRGTLDLYVTNITDPEHNVGVNPGNAMLLGERKAGGGLQFSDHASELGIVDTAWGWGAAFVDVGLSGYPDLYVVQGARHLAEASPTLRNGRAFLFMNDHRGHFVLNHGTGCDVGGDQRSLVQLDYDRDGAPDLLISQVNGPVLLLQNSTTPQRNWLTIACDGRGARCLGAKVYVTSGSHTVGQVLLAGGSFLAGPPQELYFGLGSDARADSVRVIWPGGKELTLRNVAANQVLRVEAPPVSERDHLGS